jgi:L-ascorbate metabolism protein UlaG (beta-lactamase superfamily)
MKITYIHHSSFMAELDHVVFLFDYFEGEIPAYDERKPLLVFASHRHGDHFSKAIFDLAKKERQVHYLLSDDIWKRQVPKELLEVTDFIGPGNEITLNLGETIRVKTYQSTDEGVAFLIEAEGKTIYHAGDLNNWVWDGEPKEDNRLMSERYHAELDKLAGTHIDVAFMLVDPRQEKDFSLGMDDFMKKVGADVVFPMHFWGDFEASVRFKALPCAESYRDKIRDIKEKGQTFIL